MDQISKKKILIVDDDTSTIKLLSALLLDEGYDILTAKDGLDALVSVKRDLPNLVLLDIEMPEVNGYDVCYQLRYNKDFDKIPIILMTVRDKEMDDKISKQANIFYMPKPLDTQKFLKKIKELLLK
jgi:DNA-binding response OmpR family regulator